MKQNRQIVVEFKDSMVGTFVMLKAAIIHCGGLHKAKIKSQQEKQWEIDDVIKRFAAFDISLIEELGENCIVFAPKLRRVEAGSYLVQKDCRNQITAMEKIQPIIEIIGRQQRRVDPDFVAKSLGAEKARVVRVCNPFRRHQGDNRERVGNYLVLKDSHNQIKAMFKLSEIQRVYFREMIWETHSTKTQGKTPRLARGKGGER